MMNSILPAVQETSIAFQTNKTPSEYKELAQLANQYGFDVVSVYGDMPFQPSFGPLLLMAPYLDRARLGPACIAPSRFSPLDMAGDLALLDNLTKGRAYLGVARGAWLEKYGIREVKPPVQAIRTCVEIVNALLSGANIPENPFWPIETSLRLTYETLRKQVPILIGTWGKQLGAAAGEIADEVKIGGSANPGMIPVMRKILAEGERKAGRAEGSVGIVIGAVTVVDEDSRAAKNVVKRELAVYLPVVAALDATITIEPEFLARVDSYVDQHDLDRAAALISDDLLAKFAFAGSPEEVLEHTQRLYDAGARRVEFGTPHGIQSATGIKLLGERVLPHLKLKR